MPIQRTIARLMLGTTLFAVLMFARSASASVLWRGDYSTGNLKQWTGTEMVSSDRLSVIKDPLGSSTLVLKATVHQGDDPINSSGNRNEVFYEGDDVGNGQAERYYHWRTMWPTDYASASTWQLFTQWHQYNGGGSPPLEFFVNGENIDLTILRNGDHPTWTVPLQRGVWHDFVVHVRWSTDASVGFVEVWYDGTLALPKTYGATMLGSDGVYLKQGLYRDETISATQSVYHTGMVIGTTLDDVWPSTPEPAPPPSSTDTGSNSGTTGTGSDTTSGSTSTGSTTTTTDTSGTQSAASATVSNIKAKAGCASPGVVGIMAFLPMLLSLLARRYGRRAGAVRS